MKFVLGHSFELFRVVEVVVGVRMACLACAFELFGDVDEDVVDDVSTMPVVFVVFMRLL